MRQLTWQALEGRIVTNAKYKKKCQNHNCGSTATQTTTYHYAFSVRKNAKPRERNKFCHILCYSANFCYTNIRDKHCESSPKTQQLCPIPI